MQWDRVKTQYYPEDKLDEMERVWIQYFKPVLNLKLKHEKKFKSKTIVKSYKRYMHFRKLTRKSFIDIGGYKHTTVNWMLDAGKKWELAKLYYNLSHITFFDDILDEIGITLEWRIEKPGTNKEKLYEFSEAIFPDRVEYQRKRFKVVQNERSKRILKQMIINDSRKSYHRKFNQK